MVKSIIFGLLGAAIGGFVVYKYCEKMYNDQIDHIIRKECDAYKKKAEEVTNLAVDIVKQQMDIDNEVLNEPIKPNTYNKIISTLGEVEEAKTEPIFVISEDDFGWSDDYETITLTYYNNDVVVDEMDVPVENPDIFLGENTDWRHAFKDDCVAYVRNTIRKIDYEILKDENNYEPQD